jgi:uncharacterized membrane protein
LDLVYFYNIDIEFAFGFWKIFQTFIASLFIFLVGVSLVLSSQRGEFKFSLFLKKGLKIFSFGILITIATKIIFPNDYIIFGILHFIGVAIVLSFFFVRFKYIILFVGFLFIFGGGILIGNFFQFSYLLPLGFVPVNYTSLDYFPILPWFGVVLFGMFWAQLFYKDSKRLFVFNAKNNNFATKSLAYLGKKSLIIYLIHQPILFLVFYLIKLLNIS